MTPRGRSPLLEARTFTGMALLRLGAAGLIAALALARRAFPGNPPAYALPLGLGLAALVAAAALVQLRRPGSRPVAVGSVVVDATVASGLALASGFDLGAHDLFFGLALPVQAEAVVILGLPGGLAVWAVTSAVHLALEVSEGMGGGG
jgi:hypothetical protein